MLQAGAIDGPVLQRAFSTASLSGGDWMLCTAVASSVLLLGEVRKRLIRMTRRRVGGRSEWCRS
uniref:cation transporting ATPase C-terminal domain-containing protein n=1 Tax=Methylobacterium sp. CB376 TaxID=3138063 RepID=UPI003133CD36